MKIITTFLFVLICNIGLSQTFEIVKRFEQNSINLKFSEKKLEGQFDISDSIVSINNKLENLSLNIILKEIKKNELGISGTIICKDSKNNKYTFMISDHLFSGIAEIWDEKKNDINYKTIIYTIK
jgi:hypothetical protein